VDKIYDLLPLFLGWIDSFKPKEMSNASGVGSLPLNSLKSWPVETADPLVRNVLLNLADTLATASLFSKPTLNEYVC